MVKCHTQCFLIILVANHFFQPSHNTKRVAKHFGVLKRLKTATGRRETEKNVFGPVYQTDCKCFHIVVETAYKTALSQHFETVCAV